MRTVWIILWVISFSVWTMVLDVQAQNASEEFGLEDWDYQDYDELNLEDLLDVTISIASGRAQTLEEAPGIVSVITAEDIRRIGARTLEEVLEIVPGFEVVTNDLGRKIIVARGVKLHGSSENVLVLFNGHRLNEEFNGGATLINPDMPVDNIKRVEIIRGPGSALFGANAFVGVINIITHTAEDLEGVTISGGGGSFHSQQYNLLFGHTLKDLSLSGFLQYADTDGPQLPISADFQTLIDQRLAPLGIPAVSRAPGNTADYYKTLDANVQAAYKGLTLNGRIKDEISGGFIGNTNILGNTELDYRQIALDTSYRYALGEQANFLGRFSFTQNNIREFHDFLPPGVIIPTFDGGVIICPDGALFEFMANLRRFGGEVILDYSVFEKHQFTLGLSFGRESVFDQSVKSNFDVMSLTPLPSFQTQSYTVIPNETSRDIFSVFMQDIWNPFPELGFTIGARYDRYSDFGETVNPRAAVVWRFARNFNLKLLYGSAFRAPSFFELFYTVPNFLEGNLDLKPSTIQTVEAALGYTFHKNVRISVNYFANFIEDFIVPVGGLESFAFKRSQMVDADVRDSWVRMSSSEPAARSLTALPTDPLSYINSSGIDVQGVEFEVNANVHRDISGFLNYAYQYPKEKGTGERLPDVPSHLANLGMTVGIGRHVSVTPTLLIRGSRPRVAEDSRNDVPGYALLNVNLQAKNLFRTLEIAVTVNNLLDKDYVDPASINTIPGDYPRPGRSVFVKATYRF